MIEKQAKEVHTPQGGLHLWGKLQTSSTSQALKRHSLQQNTLLEHSGGEREGKLCLRVSSEPDNTARSFPIAYVQYTATPKVGLSIISPFLPEESDIHRAWVAGATE